MKELKMVVDWLDGVDWGEIIRIWNMLNWYEWILVLVGTWHGAKFLLGFIRYLNRVFGSRHLIHMQITLPKNDSKLDREKSGIREKDFHEQVSKAEQLYRSLYETRDLNLYNSVVRTWFFDGPDFSFEFQFVERQFVLVVTTTPYYLKIMQKQITSIYESAEIEILKEKDRIKFNTSGTYYNGYYMHTKKDFWFPIETYKKQENDAMNSLANSFSKVEKDEMAAIQMVFHPISDRWQDIAKKRGEDYFSKKEKESFNIPIIGSIFRFIFFPFKLLFGGYDAVKDDMDSGNGQPGASSGDSYVRMLASEEEIAKSIGEKAIQSGFKTTIRVMVGSPRKRRVQEILDGIFTAFNVFKGKGKNKFENRRTVPLDFINAPIINHAFHHRLPALMEKDSILCSEELASLWHLPDARFNLIPTIKWLDYKVLPPPINLPKEGITLGESVYRGERKDVQYMREDRTRHTYVVGKSGSGKSVLIWNMAIQDIANGEGLCVVDPHGDLVEDCLSCIPKERAKDVVVFDPGDRERPLGLNLLEAETAEEKDRASLDAMEIFIKLFGNEIFGPRIQHYFRNGCLTLMDDPEDGATLIDIPRLFIDDEFQAYKVSKIKNPMVRAFWDNEMANTGDREKQEMIPYFTSKFGPFVTNTTMRNIIGQTKSAFNIRQIMDEGKILLINLSKGKIGGINAQLLGLIVVAKINQAAMGRADMPAHLRKDFYLYVDEFQNFATDTFASILSEARKYRLNLIMAHQYIAQLTEGAGGVATGQKDSKIKDAVFGNVGTMINFKVGAEDAEYFEKEYAPTLSSQDILGIANYKAYLKLNINNTTSRPFSMSTLYDPDLKNAKVAEIIKKYSRMKFGRKKEFVDQEIEARMGIDTLDSIAKSSEKDPSMKSKMAESVEADKDEQDKIAMENPDKAEKIEKINETNSEIHKEEGHNELGIGNEEPVVFPKKENEGEKFKEVDLAEQKEEKTDELEPKSEEPVTSQKMIESTEMNKSKQDKIKDKEFTPFSKKRDKTAEIERVDSVEQKEQKDDKLESKKEKPVVFSKEPAEADKNKQDKIAMENPNKAEKIEKINETGSEIKKEERRNELEIENKEPVVFPKKEDTEGDKTSSTVDNKS